MHPTGRPRRREVLAIGVACCAWPAAAATFVHPANEPAGITALAPRSPMLAVARAGDRLVAAGLRGLVVYSDDEGRNWRQAMVPVRVDLVGLSFPGGSRGWAVGHEGVLLVTRDGGATWARRLAGRQALELALRHYQAVGRRDADEERALRELRAQSARGSGPPFLDVHFEDEASGFIVGAFNTIYRTGDAGETWVPWMHHTPNPQALHINTVRGSAGEWYLAGEQGTVWRLQAGGGRFLSVPTAYRGTLFGLLTDTPAGLLAFGMRGSVFRSADRGTSWHKVTMPTVANITGGAALPDGRIALVDQAGGLHLSDDAGNTFRAHPVPSATPHFGVVAAGSAALVLCGPRGVERVALR